MYCLSSTRFSSAYALANGGNEVPYTTWKIREDGEHVETLDYIFHTPNLEVDAVLDCPSGDDIGENRLPSPAYASDHFSLVCDLKLTPSSSKRKIDTSGKSEH